MAQIIRRAALLGALTAFGVTAAHAADSTNDQLQSMSPSQIQSAIQSLPPQVRGQILQQLQGKSTEELMNMSPEQAQAALQGLSPDMKKQLKEQWASISPDQKAFLKSLNLRDLAQRLKSMTGPQLAMLRHMVERALGGGTSSEDQR